MAEAKVRDEVLDDAASSGSGRDEGDDEDPEVEPPESEPGLRLLWAAQKTERLPVLDALLSQEQQEQRRTLVRFRDSDGYTALHRACYSNNLEAARLLLLRGASVSAQTDEDCWQPLHSAARWDSAECAELLLGWGADVNAKTLGGQTPLHLAAFAAKGAPWKTLQLLLMDPKLAAMNLNRQEDTPKDIAARNSNPASFLDLALPAFRNTEDDYYAKP